MYNLTNTTENGGRLGEGVYDYYQCTLTFRRDVGKREADRTILGWLGSGLRRLSGANYEFRSEISKGLRYHFHGYFEFKGEDRKTDQAIKSLLFKWKHKYGFVHISKGPIEGWKRYITKDSGSPEQIVITKRHVEEYTKMLNEMAYDRLTIDEWFQAVL